MLLEAIANALSQHTRSPLKEDNVGPMVEFGKECLASLPDTRPLLDRYRRTIESGMSKQYGENGSMPRMYFQSQENWPLSNS